MVQINARAWGEERLDEMLDYIRSMQKEGFKIQIINLSDYIAELIHDELVELGFKQNRGNTVC